VGLYYQNIIQALSTFNSTEFDFKMANLINGLGGATGFGENFLERNDDRFTGFIDVTSVFESGLNFFGTNYTGFYINNNGNITFGSGLSTFTPFAINGNTAQPIIAPFFTDIDTRAGAVTASPNGTSTGSNLLYYDLDPVGNAVTVSWDDVGEFSNGIVPNAFQLRLVDTGSSNFSIEFRYEDIQWARDARAGYSAGNGTNFFELPESGTNAVLNLETLSNIGEAGVYKFAVVNGIPTRPPTDILLTQNQVNELSLNNTLIGNLSTIDPDIGDTHIYSLVDDAGGRFAINNNNQLIVANGIILDFEQSQTHQITIRSTDVSGLSLTKNLTISILDVIEPTISVSATDSAAEEKNAGVTANPGQFILTRTGSTSDALTVNYTISGTATNTTDYNDIPLTTTFMIGSNTAIINVNVLNDNIFEGSTPETVILTLANNPYYNISANGSATTTVLDNDSLPTVSIDDVTIRESRTETVNANFVVSLSNPSSSVVTLSYTTADGSATAGSDYVAITNTLTFTPGETTKNITIAVNPDIITEIPEDLSVNLTDVLGAALGSKNSGKLTIYR
jgi:hypothetical protein